MNANVSIYQDSIRDSSGILTSESNEIGSLKIIMPDKLNQLTARSSYICHIDDFVKGNKDYYGFDIQSDSEMEYDYELIINKIKHINNNTGKHEYISIFNNFPVLGFMLCQIANLNDLRILGGYRYSIRLKNISERDIVIDYINSIFITYDNICIYKVDNIDVRRDIPREFIDLFNLRASDKARVSISFFLIISLYLLIFIFIVFIISSFVLIAPASYPNPHILYP